MSTVIPEHKHRYGLFGPGTEETCGICGTPKPDMPDSATIDIGEDA